MGINRETPFGTDFLCFGYLIFGFTVTSQDTDITEYSEIVRSNPHIKIQQIGDITADYPFFVITLKKLYNVETDGNETAEIDPTKMVVSKEDIEDLISFVHHNNIETVEKEPKWLIYATNI